MTTIFNKIYDGASLYDLARDVEEAFEKDYNDAIEPVPVDEDGFYTGTFTVKIEWTP